MYFSPSPQLIIIRQRSKASQETDPKRPAGLALALLTLVRFLPTLSCTVAAVQKDSELRILKGNRIADFLTELATLIGRGALFLASGEHAARVAQNGRSTLSRVAKLCDGCDCYEIKHPYIRWKGSNRAHTADRITKTHNKKRKG